MGGLAYHVLNRAAGRGALFEKAADYEAFERVLAQAWARLGRKATVCRPSWAPPHDTF